MGLRFAGMRVRPVLSKRYSNHHAWMKKIFSSILIWEDPLNQMAGAQSRLSEKKSQFRAREAETGLVYQSAGIPMSCLRTTRICTGTYHVWFLFPVDGIRSARRRVRKILTGKYRFSGLYFRAFLGYVSKWNNFE